MDHKLLPLLRATRIAFSFALSSILLSSSASAVVIKVIDNSLGDPVKNATVYLNQRKKGRTDWEQVGTAKKTDKDGLADFGDVSSYNDLRFRANFSDESKSYTGEISGSAKDYSTKKDPVTIQVEEEVVTYALPHPSAVAETRCYDTVRWVNDCGQLRQVRERRCATVVASRPVTYRLLGYARCYDQYGNVYYRPVIQKVNIVPACSCSPGSVAQPSIQPTPMP